MDDSFTEKLLQRTRARQESLNRKINRSGVQTTQKQITVSNSLRKRPSPLREDNPPVEEVQAKKLSESKSPVKKKVSFKSIKDVAGDSKENNDNVPSLKGRLKKLAKLHSGEDEVLESPPPKPQRLYPDLSSIAQDEANLPTATPLKKPNRLASLADKYKSLEDESSQISFPNDVRKTSDTLSQPGNNQPSSAPSFTQALKKFETSQTNQVGIDKNSGSLKRNPNGQSKSAHAYPQNTISASSATVKAAKTFWDDGIVSTLKSQGFVHSPSKSKLQYEFDKDKKSTNKTPRKNECFLTPAPPPMPTSNKSDNTVSKKIDKTSFSPQKKQTTPQKTQSTSQDKVTFSPVRDIARFDIKLKSTAASLEAEEKKPSPMKNKTDPSVLPLSARVALFEKANQAEAQAAAKARTMMSPKRFSFKKTVTSQITTPQKVTSPTKLSKTPQKTLVRVPSSVGKATETIHRQLQNRTEEWKSKEIVTQMKSERRNDMHLLLSRWEQATAMMEGQDINIERKPSSTSIQRNGKSDDANSVTSSDLEPMGSLGSADEENVEEDSIEEDYRNEPDEGFKQPKPPAQSETFTRESDDSVDGDDENSESGDGNVSDLLDEAIEGESSGNEGNSSFMQLANEYVKTPVKTPPKTPPKIVSVLKVNTNITPPKAPRYYFSQSSDEEESALLHSVSFYRRQQQEVRTPPARKIVRQEEPRNRVVQKKEEQVTPLKDKIRFLQEKINAEQSVISQTSQALNLCRSSAEFHGSAEQVEGERLLLIATHKRQAYTNEIQRLKTESALKGEETNAATGSLSLKNVSLPLKKDYLNQSNNGRSGDFVHFFLCLVKHGAQVIATQMLSTMDHISNGMLTFPNLINLRDLNSHFNIVFEVYGLQTKRNQVTSDRSKTLTKKDKSKLNLTPLKKSKTDSKTFAIQSPGGPSAVRTSSFALIGFVNINLKSLSRKTWILEKVPYISPLDGNLLMTIHCMSDYNIEEKGFLTMFEDVSGFGAWHRRWFVLSGTLLSYWKYPDDEKNRREPIGSIDLRSCVTANVGLVSRDICARPNTFMLITVRLPMESEEESLVCQRFGSYTSIKHLLSADTKEDRILWCDVLNNALRNIRMWDPDAENPFDFNPSDTEY